MSSDSVFPFWTPYGSQMYGHLFNCEDTLMSACNRHCIGFGEPLHWRLDELRKSGFRICSQCLMVWNKKETVAAGRKKEE